ncbi:hypothetical protein GCM10010121_073610 [Streptomyces brasiliensis]|uniref:Uncharacterized protein n=1 Tax=Streptomyces brasiliensis TaxID=1954 RepID=A0A917P1S8_9ACTN|nr:hypothetical protein GCM10010121_073610 [Streptomyces brasiliensis]
MQHGWWHGEAVTRGRFISWVAGYGTVPSARLLLADEVEARAPAVWPDERGTTMRILFPHGGTWAAGRR